MTRTRRHYGSRLAGPAPLAPLSPTRSAAALPRRRPCRHRSRWQRIARQTGSILRSPGRIGWLRHRPEAAGCSSSRTRRGRVPHRAGVLRHQRRADLDQRLHGRLGKRRPAGDLPVQRRLPRRPAGHRGPVREVREPRVRSKKSRSSSRTDGGLASGGALFQRAGERGPSRKKAFSRADWGSRRSSRTAGRGGRRADVDRILRLWHDELARMTSFIRGGPMRLVPLQTLVVPSFSHERLLTGDYDGTAEHSCDPL